LPTSICCAPETRNGGRLRRHGRAMKANFAPTTSSTIAERRHFRSMWKLGGLTLWHRTTRIEQAKQGEHEKDQREKSQ
jgi:hypothetical protein